MSINKQSIILGTLFLSLSSIFVRLLGFVFRVYLSNTMGAEGMGIYSLIMSVYGLCSTVATSGLSIAVSKLVAEQLAFGHRADALRVLRRAVSLALGISTAVGVVVFSFAQPIATLLLGDARTMLSLRLMAPGMPCLAVSACFRGYFIAGRHMGNPATGNMIEQVSKMAFILLLMQQVLPLGLEYGCALVVLGMTLGEVICLVYTLAGYLLERRGYRPARATLRGTTRAILAIALPISVGSYIRSGLRLVEDVLVVQGFRIYTGQADIATGTYGILKGMVMPLLIFPLSLLGAFVSTLTPEISRLGARENPYRLERAIDMVLRYTCLLGIFIVGVFMTFADELGMAIYHDPQVGETLQQMAFLVPFMCVEMVVVGILQGLDEQVSSLRYNIGDCLLRIALVAVLIPRYGSNGFLWMVVASNLFTSLLNLRRLMKITTLRLRWREWIFQPVLAALAAGQGCKALIQYALIDSLPLWAGLGIGLMLMAGLYLVVLIGLGALRKGDLTWILDRVRSSTKTPKMLTDNEL